ncbi:MAG: HAMP domain-containing histidine kinase [Erysipelotrichaceae bacterium]|nr:HAMP domain-containing histidine kinase [Erysipelotrichaceae bacterium]
MFKKKNKSLITTWVVFFIVGSLVIFGIFLLSIYAFQLYYLSYYSSISDIVKYESKLKNDDFINIPMQKYRNSAIIAFGEKNEVLYTSDESLRESVKAEDLWLIKNEDGSMYYNVYSDANVAGNSLIVLVRQTNDGPITSDYCIVDKNLNVISGSLFSSVSKLTQHQLNLIEGTFKKSTNETMDIAKYEYLNGKGERRTIVFVSPYFDSTEYDALVRRSWVFLPIPIILGIAFILFMTYLFNRRLKASVHPVSEAIVKYGQGESEMLDAVGIYSEYEEIIDSFSSLMQELEESNRAKVKAEEERHRAIANISHDLKTPLTVIQGYARAIIDGIVPEEKRDDYLETIYNKAIYSSEMMDTLLAYTKMDYPEYSLHLNVVDFNEFCREYLASKYADIEFAGFEFHPSIDEEPLMDAIDVNLMIRCFNNLIDNSLKYNEPGTGIYFKVTQEENHIIINVADDGIGINADIRDRIFEPFVTENNARTPGKGTGLGMTITKTIIELHGGTIHVVNHPTLGKGAEFEISLPIITEINNGKA